MVQEVADANPVLSMSAKGREVVHDPVGEGQLQVLGQGVDHGRSEELGGAEEVEERVRRGDGAGGTLGRVLDVSDGAIQDHGAPMSDAQSDGGVQPGLVEALGLGPDGLQLEGRRALLADARQRCRIAKWHRLLQAGESKHALDHHISHRRGVPKSHFAAFWMPSTLSAV